MAAFVPEANDPRIRKVIAEAAAYDALLGDALLGDALLGDALLGDALLGDALPDVVTRLWDSEGFLTLSPSDRRLNRPRILHGRSTGYGTAANSSRLLFTFDLLASLVAEAERKKALSIYALTVTKPTIASTRPSARAWSSSA
jgi:hypothetical protein